MTCSACELDPCVCHPAEPVKIRSTYTPLSHGITREQFGDDLYAAIVTVGKILQLKHQRQHVAPDRIKKGQLRDWQVEESGLIKELRVQIGKLSEDHVVELARRYEFVRGI